ncbi:CHASE domain-containing protein [Frigidibacter oleivorans]|uniref:CHASE domain-containing protein n=1 Tax=Frigidibacter oleivorans TaxID=2487129 RepID=UPI000F8E0E7C|nr:CHASE domain-containing protein [Frigidibacter oleivorans]
MDSSSGHSQTVIVAPPDAAPEDPPRLRLLAVLAVALAYFGFGSLGLELAIAPVHSGTIWPGAGVALASLLVLGRRCWPGITLGAMALVLHAFGPDTPLTLAERLTVALAIGIGATLQAVLATLLLRQFFGAPLALNQRRDWLVLALAAGPAGCLLSPAVAVLALAWGGIVPAAVAPDIWFGWWLGDMLGVAIVLPLALLGPAPQPPLLWRGQVPARIGAMGAAIVLLCLGATLYAWAMIGRIVDERNDAAFDRIADVSVSLLTHRLESYIRTLDAAAGLVAASDRLEVAEWRAFVAAQDLEQAMPGVVGLGLIVPVPAAGVPALERQMAAEIGAPFRVHPDSAADTRFIVRLIEPLEQNGPALGLDFAIDPVRVALAETARDTGLTRVTPPLALVQDVASGPAFLLIQPVYRGGQVPQRVADRRARHMGWVYAPLVARDFFDGIMLSEPRNFDLTVTDAAEQGTDARTVFASARAVTEAPPAHQAERQLNAFGRSWSLTFRSTGTFVATTSEAQSGVVLIVGLMLTAMVGTLFTLLQHRTEVVQALVDAKTRELASQEQHTRSVIDTAMVGILLLDHRGRIIALNRAAEAIFEARSSELLGRPLSGLVPIGPVWPLPEENLASAPERALRVERADGQGAYLELQFNRWEAEDGQARHTAIIRDITVRQRAETQLAEAERRWNLALTGARIAVFDVDLRRRRQIVSHNWFDLMGMPAPEGGGPVVIDRDVWLRRLHPEDAPQVLAADLACARGETDRSIAQYRILTEDGHQRWMRSEATVPEHDGEGRPIRLLGVQIDVTELQEALEALRRSEARFREVVDLAPVGMALVDGGGRLVQANAALCRFTGFGGGELVGMRLSDLLAPGSEGVACSDFRALDRGERRLIVSEDQYLRKDGRPVWGLLSVSRLAGDGDIGGDIGGGAGSDGRARYIAQIQDITERKEVEQLKSDFVATVSHELRTPLTSIKGSIGLVLGAMGADLPPKASRLLSIGQKNCDRLITLVNDILDMEKIASGRSHFSMVAADIGALVEQAVAANQPYGQEFEVAFALDRPAGRLMASVDLDRFQQVMANLLSNAAKFSPRGGRVAVTVQSDGRRVRVGVRDHGEGVPEEFRDHIFEPFSQADSSATRAKGGTGLGLNISRQIMDRMNGEIGFDSRPGEGAEFWITLPLLERVGRTALLPAPEGQERPARCPAILHVEDDSDFAEVFRSAFGARADVTCAASIAEATEALNRRRFDLVVLDWSLPDGGGQALLAVLAELQPDAAVFGLSAQDTPVPDPRIRRNIIKSRAQLDRIVEDMLAAVV